MTNVQKLNTKKKKCANTYVQSINKSIRNNNNINNNSKSNNRYTQMLYVHIHTYLFLKLITKGGT